MSKSTVPPLPSKINDLLFKKTTEHTQSNERQLQPKIYALEDGILSVTDSDEDVNYNEINAEIFEEMSDSPEVEETLEAVVRNLHLKSLRCAPNLKIPKFDDIPSCSKKSSVVDDYIRNFLSTKGMSKTLETFQIEWNENIQSGKITPADLVIVPSVYQQNQYLAELVSNLRDEQQIHKDAAEKLKFITGKLKKERDYYKMHHSRVEQEKAKLLVDFKRVKKQYEHYDPALQQLKHKYESSIKERTLLKLENEKLINRLRKLESKIEAVSDDRPVKTDHSKKHPKTKIGKSVKLPAQDRPNPNLELKVSKSSVERFKLKVSIQAHSMAISSLKFHPTKQILATVSDDKTWKLWSFPAGEVMMSGAGHQDWIADCDFHPSGNQFATASGDRTVKLWDFSMGVATATLTDHAQAVWSCAFHDLGNHIISGSMDHTAKLWDIQTARCKQTFRGHVDSVNHVGFVPFTNTLYTCSGDRTISFWDARNNVCSQTLFGHNNAINHAAFSSKGTVFASCDAGGIVKFWDIRMTKELRQVETGNQSLNKLSFDPSGSVLSMASDNGFIRFIIDGALKGELKVSDDSCQAVAFERSGEYLVACGNDGSFKIFQ